MQLRTEHIYREFLRLTRRLSNSQIMMLLAVVVGILAGLGTYLFEILLHGIKSGLIRWFPVDSAHVLFLKIISGQSLRQILSGHFLSCSFFNHLRKLLDRHIFTVQNDFDLFPKC